jgi:hypothetical protein
VEIVELSSGEVDAAADELAQLLLDAHAANMALGLSGPLTAEHARGRRRVRPLSLTRPGTCRAATSYSARPDGTLAGSAFYYREL